METIYALIQQFKRFDAGAIPGNGTHSRFNDDPEKNRYNNFYTGLKHGNWATEADIARHFGYDSVYDKGFKRLKEGFTNRLLNALILTDNMTNRNQDGPLPVSELYRLWTAAEILRKRGATQAFISIAQKCLDMAVANHNAGMAVEIARQLRFIYRADPSKTLALNKAKLVFNIYWPIYQKEIAIQNDYNDLLEQMGYQKGNKNQFASTAGDLFRQYADQLDESQNPIIQYYTRLFQVWSFTFAHRWSESLLVIEEALSYFVKIKRSNSQYTMAFMHLKACSLMMVAKYKAAEKVLQQLLPLCPEGSVAWFKNRELLTVNALYAANYHTALELVSSSIKNLSYSAIPELDKETWRLYHAYLHFLLRKGEVKNASINEETFNKFRLKKWLNDMPLHSNDKRGGNIPVLILQVHLLLLEFNEQPSIADEIEKRAEALRKYASRNLDKNNEHFRTDCFLSLIQLLPKFMYNADWNGLFLAARPILMKMELVPTGIADTSYEIEIVPYERQWEWILDMLTGITPPKYSSVPASKPQFHPLQQGFQQIGL